MNLERYMSFAPENGWTKAQILNHIIDNFKGKSKTQEDETMGAACMYRDSHGRKCAVGLFIPDNFDLGSNNTTAVDSLLNNRPDLAKKMPLHKHALVMFQQVHDGKSDDTRHDLEIMVDLIEWVENNVKDVV